MQKTQQKAAAEAKKKEAAEKKKAAAEKVAVVMCRRVVVLLRLATIYIHACMCGHVLSVRVHVVQKTQEKAAAAAKKKEAAEKVSECVRCGVMSACGEGTESVNNIFIHK